VVRLDKYRDKVIELAREAGQEALGYYRENYSIEEKKDNSPVTEADLASEEILIDGLKNTGYGIVAEETGLVEGDKEDLYWIVDPLDGTQDFIDKTGEFSIMVGLLVEGEPQFGVVFAPAQEKLWYAAKGKGAYLLEDGKETEISVAGKKNLEDYELIASRNHFSETDKRVARELGVSEVTRMGSLGIKFCSIAEGRADLAYYTTDKLGIWDCCAPHVILEEAGGRAFDVYGGELQYDLGGKRMDKGVIGIGGEAHEKVVGTLEAEMDELVE
jgi:3'(2'), 5'-bisphosphate nucleotidase